MYFGVTHWQLASDYICWLMDKVFLDELTKTKPDTRTPSVYQLNTRSVSAYVSHLFLCSAQAHDLLHNRPLSLSLETHRRSKVLELHTASHVFTSAA